MPGGYGLITQAHSLQQLKLARGMTVLQYGEGNMYANVDAAFRAANAEVALLVGRYCKVTNQRAGLVGGDTDNVEVEELTSTERAQSETGGVLSEVGWPLRKYGKRLAWTRDALEVMQVSEFAANVTRIITGDKRNIIRQIQRSIYVPTSYDFYDTLLDRAKLKVKPAGWNADGSPIPYDPYGTPFTASTHTHYLARAGGAFVESDLERLVNTVAQHGFEGTIKIEIDSAQEATVRTFGDFEKLLYVGSVPGADVSYNDQQRLDPRRTKDRVIGYWRGYEVAVRYTAIPGYVMAYVDDSNPEGKPLAIRVRGTGEGSIGGALNSIIAGNAADGNVGFGDLRLVAQVDDYPLRANEWHREFGVGGNDRSKLAVLYVGGTVYVAPTITVNRTPIA